jgi:hypothetical protein
MKNKNWIMENEKKNGLLIMFLVLIEKTKYSWKVFEFLEISTYSNRIFEYFQLCWWITLQVVSTAVRVGLQFYYLTNLYYLTNVFKFHKFHVRIERYHLKESLNFMTTTRTWIYSHGNLESVGPVMINIFYIQKASEQ